MENYWQILLEKWREEGRDGFTIPYLIGSQNYLSNPLCPDGIRELITSIAYSNCQVYITYCMNIGDIILGIYENEKQKIAGKFIIQDGYETNLFLSKFLSELGNDLESVIKSLIEDYQEDIDAHRYSRNNGVMGDFSIEEIDFIKSSFKL